MKKKNELLGFLSLYQSSSTAGYIGALLITNLQGIPQEFRCTHPIKPTAIQRQLYGDMLEPYVAVTLCATPLIKAMQHRPSFIVVDRDFLLDARLASPCPVLYIRRAGEVIDIKTDNLRNIPKERVDCSTGNFQPIVFSVHRDFEEDLKLREAVENIFTHLDFLEPFERISKALKLISEQDKRFQ